MKAILVDNESSALASLKIALHKIGGVTIIGKYTNAYIAKQSILNKKPDIVFLDIEMPGISGIQLAEELQCSLPEIHIVFITAYDEYAVKAFELNAIDYLLKPVRSNRLKETIQRIAKYYKKEIPSDTPKRPPMICAFQSLSFMQEDYPSKTIDVRWRTSKVRGVFIFLLQHRGDFIRKDTLLDLFWPELDIKKGYTQLYSAIYQIRKTLADNNMQIHISNLENGYKLNMDGVKFDVDLLERGIESLPVITNETLPEHQQLLMLYRGDYLANEDYMWLENERERLKILWIKHTFKVADYFVNKNQYSEAISLYLHLQMAQPYIEECYFKLMQLYSEIGEIHSVERQYNHLQSMLRDQYGNQPQQDIQDWYQNWKKKWNKLESKIL